MTLNNCKNTLDILCMLKGSINAIEGDFNLDKELKIFNSFIGDYFKDFKILKTDTDLSHTLFVVNKDICLEMIQFNLGADKNTLIKELDTKIKAKRKRIEKELKLREY